MRSVWLWSALVILLGTCLCSWCMDTNEAHRRKHSRTHGTHAIDLNGMDDGQRMGWDGMGWAGLSGIVNVIS